MSQPKISREAALREAGTILRNLRNAIAGEVSPEGIQRIADQLDRLEERAGFDLLAEMENL